MSNIIKKQGKRKKLFIQKLMSAKQIFIYYIIICSGLCTTNCIGNKVNNPKKITTETWNNISAYFKPPAIYENKYGEYRSPLLPANGDSIKSASEWKKRRKEIKEEGMSLIGEWPPVITNQKFEIINTLKREDFYQYRVRFCWTPNEQTEGYLLIPDKRGKKPAVISVFYEPETAIGSGGKPNRDFAYQLTKRGFITLSLGTTQTTKEKTYSIYYPDINNASIQPLSALAYAAANAWEVLAKVTEVDSTKIGIVGHSYGGKWAMFASCLYEKFACAVWSDPGIVFDETKGGYINYWEPWYLGYYTPPWKNTWNVKGYNTQKGVYSRLRKEKHDLHELHALMAPRPFLVSGGFSDGPERWIPLNHTILINRLLGYKNRVAMTNRPKHDPNPESNEVVYNFFKWYLLDYPINN